MKPSIGRRVAAGFVAFRDMHGADRAQEEVEAYGAQVKVLREIIARIRCGYRATGQDGPVVYSGVICSLPEPFKVTGTHPMFTFPFEFVPSSPTAGMMTYGTSGSGIAAAGGGPYVIEGADTDSPRIVVNTRSTASSRAATTSGGGKATINYRLRIPASARPTDLVKESNCLKFQFALS